MEKRRQRRGGRNVKRAGSAGRECAKTVNGSRCLHYFIFEIPVEDAARRGGYRTVVRHAQPACALPFARKKKPLRVIYITWQLVVRKKEKDSGGKAWLGAQCPVGGIPVGLGRPAGLPNMALHSRRSLMSAKCGKSRSRPGLSPTPGFRCCTFCAAPAGVVWMLPLA